MYILETTVGGWKVDGCFSLAASYPYQKGGDAHVFQLNYAVFDWKDIDGLVEFLAIVTEHGPFCFRQVDAMTIVLWSSMDGTSVKAANAFYQTVVDSE
ncbi:MAG: hypothetical protein R3E39_06405 [Anaerolineae bacterium]